MSYVGIVSTRYFAKLREIALNAEKEPKGFCNHVQCKTKIKIKSSNTLRTIFICLYVEKSRENTNSRKKKLTIKSKICQ